MTQAELAVEVPLDQQLHTFFDVRQQLLCGCKELCKKAAEVIDNDIDACNAELQLQFADAQGRPIGAQYLYTTVGYVCERYAECTVRRNRQETYPIPRILYERQIDQ